jgi:hypothetical protein
MLLSNRVNVYTYAAGPRTRYPERLVSEDCQPDMGFYEGWNWDNMSHVHRFVKFRPPYSHVFGSRPPPPVKREYAGSWNETPPPGNAGSLSSAWCDWNPESPESIVDERLLRLCLQKCPMGYEPHPENRLSGDCVRDEAHTFCPNQCSGNGACRTGHCDCDAGWWGADCSLPSSASSSAGAGAGDGGGGPGQRSRRRARPLVYVYEMPTEFTTERLQWRHATEEAPRYYERRREENGDGVNFTEFERLGRATYQLELLFHEYLMHSAHRTTDPAEADFFYVPIYAALHQMTYVMRTARQSLFDVFTDDSPDETTAAHSRVKGTWMLWRKLAAFIGSGQNAEVREVRRARARARASAMEAEAGAGAGSEEAKGAAVFDDLEDLSDHIFLTVYDEGACGVPEALRSATFLTHWGNTGRKHARATTTFFGDNWQNMHTLAKVTEVRDGWSCFNPAKDIVVPPVGGITCTR